MCDFRNLYDKPEPSLCDSCIRAYELNGGSISHSGKHFIQRYCNIPLSKDQPNTGRSISDNGYLKCEFFIKKENE